MRRVSVVAVMLLALGALAGCQHPGQNVYSSREVGRATSVNFGTVLAVREIAIKGEQTGLGAATGGAIGGVAGSQFGRSGGKVASTLGGVLVGGLAGAATEQAIADRRGLEYTVTLQSGTTLTIAQERAAGDRILQPGERVMVQMSGTHQRVLPADQLPTEIKRPVGVTVKD
jgi:outer membrane lipoprotein SlyB